MEDTSPVRALPIPGVLVSRPALQRIVAIARAIPDIGDSFGFECRLGPAAGVVDLGIALRRRARVLRVDAPAPDPAWRRFSMFCRAWSDPTSLLHSWIPFVFLEFDADVPSDPIPVPSVFVSLDWPIVDPAEPEAEQGVRSLTTAVVHDALYLLLGPNGLAPFAANLGACIDALPDSGRVLHAGAMLGRSACGARLSIAMPRAAQVGYLERFGLGRSAGIVESVMATLAPTDDRVHLELDVTETIGPRIGVVLACDRPEGWAELLARLDAERFCTADERAELMRWPISHLKITPAPSGMREAKAYLNLPRSSDENGLSR